MTMQRTLEKIILIGATLGALASCTSIDSAVRSIRPPKLSDVTNMIPGLGPGDSTGSKDPLVQFAPHLPLAPGHTLRLQILEGSRSVKKLYEGLVMVDEGGVIEFKGIGSAKVGGHTAAEARSMIASVFRAAGKAGSSVHVHLISIENTPLIALEGDLARPVVLPLQDKLSVSYAILYAGGRPRGSVARSVYVVQEGQRRFFVTDYAADKKVKLQPGDIIQLSPDL